MKVCYFGIYDQSYSRNFIFLNGLKKNEIDIIECRTDKKGLKKYFDLFTKLRLLKDNFDVVLVAFPGFSVVPIAFLATRKPIVFDLFASIHDSMVDDRAQATKYSLKSLYYWLLDWISVTLADMVIIDTNANLLYVSKKYHINKKKMVSIPVGSIFSEIENIYTNKKNTKTRVIFYGSYIPLQGIEYIIMAAKILQKNENIEFVLVGDGQEKNNIISQINKLDIKNVELKPRVTSLELLNEIRNSDIALGVFGKGKKTQRVIPNKVYDYVALGVPTITADTPAIREIFDEQDLFLVPPGDPEKIVEAILTICLDIKTYKNNAINARNLLSAKYNHREIGGTLEKYLKQKI